MDAIDNERLIFPRGAIFPRVFYEADTVTVAQELLGAFLVHETRLGKIVGKIVETEAYLVDDPACHAHAGKKSARNASMFGPPGTSYIYLIYGMYYCFNVVTRERGIGEAVLIRALEPLAGLHIMQRNRNTSELRELCSGPGKLAQALGLGKEQNGISLRKKPLYILSAEDAKPTMVTSTRIGLSKASDLPLRFFIKDSPFVSRK